MQNGTTSSSISSIQPGDLIFWNDERGTQCDDPAHLESCEHNFDYGGVDYNIHCIGIYLGNNQVAEAVQSLGVSVVRTSSTTMITTSPSTQESFPDLLQFIQ